MSSSPAALNQPKRYRGRKRLYVQLSLGFLLLVTTCGVVFVATLLNALLLLRQHSTQADNRFLAESIAAQLQPALSPTLDFSALADVYEQIEKLRPEAQVYLVKASGEVLPFVVLSPIHSPELVDVSIIEAHLEDESWVPELRRIRRPGKGDQVVFSAARVEIQNEPGYLLVALLSNTLSPAETFLQADTGVKLLLVVVALAPFVALGIGLLVFSFLTKKFYELLRVVRSFQRGDYSERCNIASDNELGELAQAVNEMADTIQSNIVQLEQKDELRRRLVANISHDLRAPLGGIVTLADALAEQGGSLTKEQLEERCTGLVSSGMALTKLVDELFDLSKLEAKEVQAKRSLFDAGELVQEARARFLAQASRKSLQLEIDVEQSPLLIEADRDLLARVLDNLLANAIRHTPAEGVIRLESLCIERGIEIAIADSGEGIAEDDIARVVEPHFQAESGRLSGGGMGLGLAIVHEILALHGSALEIQSKLGEGSRFSFVLPAAQQ